MKCTHCPDRTRCMDMQRANYRVGQFIYPFARPECEPQSHASISKRVYGVLQSAGRPLTTTEAMAALDLHGTRASVAVSGAFRNLAKAGRVRKVGTLIDHKKRQINIWALAASNQP